MQDDESGLIYMRARYYEPGTGRFVSEDPKQQRANWYTYCQNLPNCRVDSAGCDDWDEAWCGFVCGLVSLLAAIALHPRLTELQDLGVFAAGFFDGFAVAKVTGPAGEATTMTAQEALGAKLLGISVGAFANAAAGLLIDWICGDNPGGDLIVDAVFGGVGGAVSPAISGAGSNGALGFFLGGGQTLGGSINQYFQGAY